MRAKKAKADKDAQDDAERKKRLDDESRRLKEEGERSKSGKAKKLLKGTEKVMDKVKDKAKDMPKPTADQINGISDNAKQKLNPDLKNKVNKDNINQDGPPNPDDDYNNNGFMASLQSKPVKLEKETEEETKTTPT